MDYHLAHTTHPFPLKRIEAVNQHGLPIASKHPLEGQHLHDQTNDGTRLNFKPPSPIDFKILQKSRPIRPKQAFRETDQDSQTLLGLENNLDLGPKGANQAPKFLEPTYLYDAMPLHKLALIVIILYFSSFKLTQVYCHL